MKKHTRIIFVAIAIIAVVGSTAATAVFLHYFGAKWHAPAEPAKSSETETPTDSDIDTSVNAAENDKAKIIENEAKQLMGSNPAEAQKKYLEAADAYSKAGNEFKAAEMRDNASTAEALTPPAEEESVEAPTPRMKMIDE